MDYATLSYAQGESEDTSMTESLGNETGMTEEQTDPDGIFRGLWLYSLYYYHYEEQVINPCGIPHGF